MSQQHPTDLAATPCPSRPSEVIPAPLYLLRVDATGNASVCFVTERLLEMLDLSRQQFLADARSIFQRVHPDDRLVFEDLHREGCAAPQPFCWEGRVVVRGVTRCWRVESFPQPLPNGGTLWEGSVMDLTDARDAQAANVALAQRTACEEAVRDISRLFLATNASILDAAINAALQRIGTCLGAHRCYLFQMDAGGLTMTCTHEWCASGIAPQIDDLQALSVARYPWLPEIAQTRQAAWINQNDIARLSSAEQRLIHEGGIQSMLAMPLFETEQAEHMNGILGLDDVQTRRRWSEFEQRLLRLVADIISAALMRDQLQQALHAQAYQDALTGLPNRRAFDERLRAELQRARRHGQVFALLLLDIDNFKAINDTHGHTMGDQVLQRLAQILVRRLRLSDALARWGGEEFGLLLPETTGLAAIRLAETLRRAVEHARFFNVERLTVSIGVSQFAPDDSIDSLFRRVDQALYSAKAQGRNRCSRL
jgi:diguanylate cyclase (GGDEF)-like protein